MTPQAGGGEVCFRTSNCDTAPRAQLGSAPVTVALLSQTLSDTASTISDKTLYEVDLESKSKKQWDDTSTEVGTASFMSEKSGRTQYSLS